MAISRIKDIKYKGFKPIEKKKVIKDINLLIDKFNDDNEELYRFFYNGSNSQSLHEIMESAMQKEFGRHRDYLLSYLHDINANVTDIYEYLDSTRVEKFQKFINSLTKNSNQSIEDIRKEIFKWYTNEKKFIKEEKDEVIKEVTKSVNMTIKRIKFELGRKQESKRNQLIKKCSELTDQIENSAKPFIKAKNKSDSKFDSVNSMLKAIRIIEALKNLKSIIFNKQGDLLPTSLKIFDECFKNKRNWKALNSSEKIVSNPPMLQSNALTNQVIINFYSMLTDRGTNIWKIIQQYLGVQIP